MSKKYNLYIGRWQPFHLGHYWLISQSKNEPVCIAVRDVEPDINNPLTADQVVDMLRFTFSGNENIKVIKIPDIVSVNYGRGVGYNIVEHVPVENVSRISATDIRVQIQNGLNTWKEAIYPKALPWIEENLYLFMESK